jgi:cytochrome oxidase Cu insertion factor (SCO1/SenC/PrrC family)
MSDAKGKSLEEIFANTPLTDQHGKNFDPAELFKDGHAIVLFGYGGCPMCQKITDTVVTLQNEMEKNGKHVPIVVVSVQPETDRDQMKDYVGKYYFKGMKQFPDEVLPKDKETWQDFGEKAFEDAKDKPQAGRILHVVCPPSDVAAQEIERRLKFIINENDPQQHSSFITLFDEGKVVKDYRGLPPKGMDAKTYANGVAATLITDLNMLEKSKAAPEAVKPNTPKTDAPATASTTTTTPSPPSNNNMLLNIGIPAGAGLLTMLFAGGGTLSTNGVLFGMLAAGAASIATQYATGTGVFEAKTTDTPRAEPPNEPAQPTTEKAKPLSPDVQAKAAEVKTFSPAPATGSNIPPLMTNNTQPQRAPGH